MFRHMLAGIFACSLLVVATISASAQPATVFKQTNLVSDIPGMAAVTDPHLVNPWGIATSPTSPFWIADNGAGVSTLYNGAGQPFPIGSPLVVTIPPPHGSPSNRVATPSGAVFNGTTDFGVTQGTASGPAQFIFVTEDGTISGWNPKVNGTAAILTVDNSAGGTGAVYKGLTLGSNASGNFLYAANIRSGTVDVFDRNYKPAHLSGAFTDPNLPAGFAPFGIQNLNGAIFVTYVKQNATKDADVAGPGNGFVDVFDTNGHLVRRLASGGTLNSPWGLVLTTASFGSFSNVLLVGNFGDGHISAFNPTSGAFLGQLADASGNTLAIPFLWGLRFGNGSQGANPNTLYFTAGIQDENHGLFGTLTPSAVAAATAVPTAAATPTSPPTLPATGELSAPIVPLLGIGMLTILIGLYLKGIRASNP